MVNFRRKFFLIPILFLVMFFTFSQAVFSGDFGYKSFYDESTKKEGYKDSSGNIVIPAKFDYASSFFSEGLASVKIGNKYGFIDKTGKTVIPVKFDGVNNFSEGLARVKIGSKWGLINKSGKLVIPAKFDYTGDYFEGLASVRIGSKLGFINKSGKLAIPAKFDYAGYFTEGLAFVKIGSKWGFINKSGKLAIPAKFDYAHPFSGGLASVWIGEGKYEINTQGVVVSSENNNSNTYTAPQKDNSAEEGKKNREQMQKNCIATCKSARSICESNAQYLSDESYGFGTVKSHGMDKCKDEYYSCEYSCKN